MMENTEKIVRQIQNRNIKYEEAKNTIIQEILETYENTLKEATIVESGPIQLNNYEYIKFKRNETENYGNGFLFIIEIKEYGS
jgi:vesicle coat complex subunit